MSTAVELGYERRSDTALANLVLLCYRHRWLLHRGLMADIVSKGRPMRRMPSARSLVLRERSVERGVAEAKER